MCVCVCVCVCVWLVQQSHTPKAKKRWEYEKKASEYNILFYGITTGQSLQLSRFADQSHHDKTDQSKPRPDAKIPLTDNGYSLDSEDDYRSGSRNVSHQEDYPQPGQSR